MTDEWQFEQLNYTSHAIQQMFGRQISTQQVRTVVENGTVIADYPEDRPYPSRLLLGFDQDRPLHVVFAYDAASCVGYIVTVYEPSLDLWESDYKTRKDR